MITPMVARLVRDPYDREGWLFELKWGGFRAIAEKDKLGVRLYSRNQNDFTKRLPVIVHAVKALDNVILDGEIVALDEQGHPRFEWLVNRGTQRECWCTTCLTCYVSAIGISDPSPCHGERVCYRNFSGRTTPSATSTTFPPKDSPCSAEHSPSAWKASSPKTRLLH